MEDKYASQVLISANQATRTTVYKVKTISGQFLCLKKQLFPTAIARNDAYLTSALQKVLVHPHICRVFDSQIGEDADGHYLLTETEWAGEDLDQVTQGKLRKNEPWTDLDCLNLLSAVVDALSFAQSRGICHRDLKPMNLFLDQEGFFRVGDFGNAKSAEQKAGIHTIAGTPIYLSPQLREAYLKQLMGKEQNETLYDPFKSDVFSLGLSVVFLLAPERISMFGNQEELMKMVEKMQISLKLKELLAWMLESEETKRPDFLQLAGKVMEAKNEVILETANSLIKNDSMEDSKAAVQLLFNLPSELYVKCEFPQWIPFIAQVGPNLSTEVSSLHSTPHLIESSLLPETQPPDFPLKPPSEKPKKRFRIIKKSQVPEKSEEDSLNRLQDSEPTLISEEKTCQICNSKFIQNPIEPWRLNLLGSALAQEMVSICSEDCKNRLISRSRPEPFYPRSQDSLKTCQECGLVSDQYYFLHCRKHVVCADHIRRCEYQSSPSLFQQCRSCHFPVSEQVVAGLPIYQNSEDEMIGFLVLTLIRGTALGEIEEKQHVFVPISMLLVLELIKDECHFCQSVLTDDWRSFSHNQHPAIICSKECIRRRLHQSQDGYVCPRCSSEIEEMRVRSVLNIEDSLSTFLVHNPDTDCSLCKFRKTCLTLPCGHQACSECLRTALKLSTRDDFPCVRCGLACDKANYVETLDLLHLI